MPPCVIPLCRVLPPLLQRRRRHRRRHSAWRASSPATVSLGAAFGLVAACQHAAEALCLPEQPTQGFPPRTSLLAAPVWPTLRGPTRPHPAVAVMMYGFGDDMAPLPETLDLVEGIVLEYATTLLHKVRCCVCHACWWIGRGGWAAGERGWGGGQQRSGASGSRAGHALASCLPTASSPALSTSRSQGSAPHRPWSPTPVQAMDSAAQRGKLRRPGAPGAGAAVGAEDILFLVRKVGAVWGPGPGGRGGWRGCIVPSLTLPQPSTSMPRWCSSAAACWAPWQAAGTPRKYARRQGAADPG